MIVMAMMVTMVMMMAAMMMMIIMKSVATCFVICKLGPAIERIRVAIMKILCKFPNLITVGEPATQSIRNLSPLFLGHFYHKFQTSDVGHTLSSHFGICKWVVFTNWFNQII